MRYGILGDIHGNLEALETVLELLAEEGVDHYVSVGDVVGYGADPGACLDRVRNLGATVVAGNHDWAVVGKLDTSFFNVYAKAAVDWTADQLTAEQRQWLENLPLTVTLEDQVSVAHSTLDTPEQFDYIQTYYDAARSINAMRTPVCFLGHSHVPLAFLKQENLTLSVATVLDLTNVERALINVGSIGQPRDENPKAAYGLYDSSTREYRLRRTTYDIRRTCEKIEQAGLPRILADRLKFGR
ncbi:MAG: metallophosphoesterase family protein [Planctomycetes bacterium]|nr:metallophosphoesterase family protein [Planctomycetota bacterium]